MLARPPFTFAVAFASTEGRSGGKLRIAVLFLSFFLSHTVLASVFQNPVVLIHGYGPRPLVNMRKMQGVLVSQGVPPDDILLLDYPQLETPAAILASTKASLGGFMSRYPAGTHFDFITHSYGNFIGIYSIMELGLAPRVDHFIGLAGIARGLNALTFCKLLGSCGKTLPQLVPFMSPFLTDFYGRHADAVEKLNKCALYSPEDSIVSDPFDSVVIPGSKTARLEKASHMAFIHDRDIFDIMTSVCYDQPLPPGVQRAFVREEGARNATSELQPQP